MKKRYYLYFILIALALVDPEWVTDGLTDFQELLLWNLGFINVWLSILAIEYVFFRNKG